MRRPKKGILVVGNDRDSSRNYMGKVMDWFRSKALQPGAAYDATVVHEDRCAALKGLGYCDCAPTVFDGTPEEFHARRQGGGKR